MENSKKIVKKAGIIPALRLGIKQDKGGVKHTGPHRVKMVSDKVIKKTDPRTGEETEWMRYTIEENGQEKNYDTRLKTKDGELSYLVQHLADINEGDEVILEMKKNGAKNYIDVMPVNSSTAEDTIDLDEEQSPPK